MGIEELVHNLADVGVPLTALATILVAIIAKSRSREETGMLSASALEKMTGSITSLREALDEECAARIEDRRLFEEQLETTRSVYAAKIDEIDHDYKLAIKRVEARYRDEMEAMRLEYEERIRRIEQGYKDKIYALRERIKLLESK